MNEYIKNPVLKEIAGIVESIKKDPINGGTDLKIKSMANKFQAKIAEIILVKRGGIIFTKMNWIKLVFRMIWHTISIKIWSTEQNLILF